MECQFLSKCPFYNDKMDIESSIGKMYKKRYCLGDKNKCARYKVSTTLGKDLVPSSLYPNMHEKAEKLISEKK